MIQSKLKERNSMKRVIQDIKAYSNGCFFKAIATIICNPNFHSVFNYRISHFLYKVHLTPISKLIWYINRILYSVDIDYRADLAGGFVLVHGIGTVIGYDVKTEGLVKIYQGVTLGGNNNKMLEREGRIFSQPWLKQNVIIYANSTIIGPVIISENSIVGANSFISKDIPHNTIVYSKKSNTYVQRPLE